MKDLNWQIIIGALMLLGFPAWIIYWADSKYILLYIYMVIGYLGIATCLIAVGVIKK